MMKKTSSKGFTLIEILIVVSIIGLLASVILVGLGGFRSRGRDTRRVADLKALQNGLELYYSRNNQYPTSVGDLLTAGIGINKLPKDPSSNNDYYYSYTGSRQSYIVGAQLEADPSDVIYNDSVEISTSGYSGSVPSCARAQKYYCVSF